MKKKNTTPKKVKKPTKKISSAKSTVLKKTKKVVKKKTLAKKVAPKKVSRRTVARTVIKKKPVVLKKETLQESVVAQQQPLEQATPIDATTLKTTVSKKAKEVKKIREHKKVVKPVSIEIAKEEKTESPPRIEKNLIPLELDVPITLKELSVKIKEKPSVLIKYLIEKQRMFVTINQSLKEEIVIKTLVDFGFEYKKKMDSEELLFAAHAKGSRRKFLSRPPVITFMGHVDHGKTSLLDAVRRSKLVDREHGGITQHIGAYKVQTPKGQITFLDTPGHEAFTAMRSRGANITDIVILVVAADDGIMPQTIEAIDHARAAKVPIVVAINKIDKQNIDMEKVKRQLAEHDLAPEDWGGKTVTVEVSAKEGQGVDELLNMISLEAEMLELKAIYDKAASGVVVEAKLSKGQGSVVTVLVQSGTLKVGDNIICGSYHGKIRAMIDDSGQRIDNVTPGLPAEILGFTGVPEAGDKIYVLNDEKQLKEIVSKRQMQARLKRLTAEPKHISLEDLYAKIQEGEVKELNLILKADVQGSLEAVKESLNKFESKEVKLSILHSGVGPVNSSDVILAEASNAIIIGFHVNSDTQAKELAASKKVEIRTYRVIYELIGEMKSALEGLLAPKIKKNFVGKIEIRKVFKLSKFGIVAGCYVVKGHVNRQVVAELTRNEETIFEGKISALKRFKDDVKEVKEGFECGISLEGFTDYKEGDTITVYTIEKIAREL